jgi:hypothetical protein
VFKLIMQHTLPRVAKHFLMAFTAVPINGLWNGLVCWQVLREARIRVMGPSAAAEMLDDILIDAPQPSPALALAIHRAVGSAIVRTQELHPNHVAIVRAARQRLGEPEQGLELDDSDQFLKALPALTVAEQRVVLRVLSVAAIIDGRLVRAEKRLLSEAYELVALPEQLVHVEQLRRAFVAGDVIEREALIAAAP